MDTIFALSSGSPPAAIGVIRVSGPAARQVGIRLAGSLPAPREAALRSLRGDDGQLLDKALVLFFDGPRTATGEDLLELHCHGGRAVIAAVQQALSRFEGVRAAVPGEFTRRAFANGRIDLAEAEGLSELLSAETELQRRSAIALTSGALSRQVEQWRSAILNLSASVESVLDFGDEDDVAELPPDFTDRVAALAAEMTRWLDRPRAEKLREGFRIVLAGPPNSGKSTLFNALLEEAVAITSAEAGTTRDVIERPVSLDGMPLVLIDTAGLRDEGAGEIEVIGIGKAQEQIERADCVLWLGPEGEGPDGAIELESRIDDASTVRKTNPAFRVSAVTGEGVDALRSGLLNIARDTLPKPGDVALNVRQAGLIREASEALEQIERVCDPLLVAEHLRLARAAMDSLTGRASTEDMLDNLFGRFCIGK
ncbi:tRNA uridine-5-carboxymethylaminomethyl(34) synthesis GTPase MnmE [Altererythrobacter aurantiacus]|uniref:tRNA modification GTPase MnmE n=1 Tax=Parapontixanthobacter aurantiacus TaxID=1463599 RepID=A0A844ZE92_9SPHN|nr:tRNA uridine-5-carboxymethylaminomethyl(34) synthesis GTPase MnmE [Parapontixanthobacter aurantiacus]MXO86841.1 tRNA uridine-5-carboxymethylaminomethyl(34) synthesis GTPase MnmE [Parapontixanthobacter aurantiacus]